MLSAVASGASSPSSTPSVVVISPPGGVGEVAAVKAAGLGSKVRWFVVSGGGGDDDDGPQQRGRASASKDGGTTVVTLSSHALEQVSQAGGSLQLAGASASSLLADMDDPASALPAVATWCQGIGEGDGVLISTLDGIDDALSPSSSSKKRKRPAEDSDDANDPATMWKNAVKVAAQEASKAVKGTKIAILSATEDDYPSGGDGGDAESKGGGLGSLVGNLFAGKKPVVPTSLATALSGDASNPVYRIRHGELFGTPESSPDFSPLVGGPRRSPEICEEYTMRSVRVDPTRSVAGNLMTGSGSRSSRHAVGDAAALVALGKVFVSGGDGEMDVCVTSLRGTDEVPEEMWNQEFQRAQRMMSSGVSGGADGTAPVLFVAEFSSVPDVRRLADW